MVPELQKGHTYYRCPRPGCPTKTVREEALVAGIEACLLRTELSVPDIAEFERRIEAWIASDEAHEREKLERSLSVACRKRPVNSAQIEKLASGIQRQLETLGESSAVAH